MSVAERGRSMVKKVYVFNPTTRKTMIGKVDVSSMDSLRKSYFSLTNVDPAGKELWVKVPNAADWGVTDDPDVLDDGDTVHFGGELRPQCL